MPESTSTWMISFTDGTTVTVGDVPSDATVRYDYDTNARTAIVTIGYGGHHFMARADYVIHARKISTVEKPVDAVKP